MSESQKREAERIVELLIETGNLHRISGDLYGKVYSKEAWIKVLTEAIAMYQGEELAKAWQKLLIKRMERKDKG